LACHFVIFVTVNYFCGNSFLNFRSLFVFQGLILSKALKAQKDAEDESHRIAIGNLRSEVITLRNEALEKDKILLSLVERLKSSEARLSAQAEAHEADIQELKKKVAEATENLTVEVVKHELCEIERSREQKNVDELRAAKEKCYDMAMECAKNLKNNFSKVGAFSSEQKFIRGNHDEVIQWINGEVEVFEEILSDKGDFCAFVGARGAASILEKVGCDHAKAVDQPDFTFLADDGRNPSAEATTLGGKFYSKVWLKGRREIADEAIKKNEKESHDALEDAKRVEEAAERARLIGMPFISRLRKFFSFGTNRYLCFNAAELSPPLEPYDSETDPSVKEALDIIKIANDAIDEVVDKLLNKVADKVLKEDWSFVFLIV
jgi:hypothetical protein